MTADVFFDWFTESVDWRRILEFGVERLDLVEESYEGPSDSSSNHPMVVVDVSLGMA